MEQLIGLEPLVIKNSLSVTGFDKLKKDVDNRLSTFKVNVSDDVSYRDLKKNRAELVKLSEAVDAERKRLNKDATKEAESITTKVWTKIGEFDIAISNYEQKLKDERLLEIVTYFETLDSPLDFEKIYDERWLNLTSNWKQELDTKLSKIKQDINTLRTLKMPDRLMELYLTTLDIESAKAAYEVEQRAYFGTIESPNTSHITISSIDIEQIHTITFKCDSSTLNKIKSEVEKLATVISVR